MGQGPEQRINLIKRLTETKQTYEKSPGIRSLGSCKLTGNTFMHLTKWLTYQQCPMLMGCRAGRSLMLMRRKTGTPRWQPILQLFKQLNITSPYNPAVTLSFYPNELKSYTYINICILTSVVLLFFIKNNQNALHQVNRWDHP